MALKDQWPAVFVMTSIPKCMWLPPFVFPHKTFADPSSSSNFSNNSLAGVLPECFGSMSKLQGLYLSDNEFQGLLPDALGQLSNLRRLYVSVPLRTDVSGDLIVKNILEKLLATALRVPSLIT